MSLSIYLSVKVDTGNPKTETIEVFESNITHNLNIMAYKAGIYCHCWRPEEIGIKRAIDLIEPLKNAIIRLEAYPEYYQQFDSKNGWGLYTHFLQWVRKYFHACRDYPNAIVEVCR